MIHRWRQGDGVAGDQDQHHLHAEGQKFPKAVVPVLNHRKRCIASDQNSHEKGHECQEQREDKRIWDESFRPASQKATCFLQHDILSGKDILSVAQGIKKS